MAAPRPNYIDLRTQSSGAISNASHRALPSPRLHVAGERPPELSPLDAFAAQSRRLARQLNESMNQGRRVSRLPHHQVASSLGPPRPNPLRSLSSNDADDETGQRYELEDGEIDRPVSTHPRLSRVPSEAPSDYTEDDTPGPGHYNEDRNAEDEEEEAYQSAIESTHQTDYGFPATSTYEASTYEASPGEAISPGGHQQNMQQFRFPQRTTSRSGQNGYRQPRPQPNLTAEPQAISEPQQFEFSGLAPPRSPFARGTGTPSIRSISVDGSEEEASNYGPPSFYQARKQSSSSCLSGSPVTSPHPMRSPSVSSEMSRYSRPVFNFSRPISRASMAPLEVPSRQASSDSQPFVLADDTVHTPVSMSNEDINETNSVQNGGAPAYLYSRFSLPRGRNVQRNLNSQETHPQAEFQFEQPRPAFSNVEGHAPPSPPSRPSTSSIGQDSASGPSDALQLSRSYSSTQSRPSNDRPSNDRPSNDRPSNDRPSYDRPSLDRPSVERTRRPTLSPRPSISQSLRSQALTNADSLASDSTIKAKSTATATAADMTADDHVTKAIECHEKDQIKESTYHLRKAAQLNHPTGMLLYALACRHGWGMRPNQHEAVQWLRKAADSASLEVADDESQAKDGKAANIAEQKTRKAQFALSIYELGVSHMNGWGIEQDKGLALRCFEIAGSWGDGDALAEAGFCYAQGVGCKKDLKKAARFYRQAEAKGISMIGNSWIYKSKYNDDGEGEGGEDRGRTQETGKKGQKGRSKSRGRMFGRR